MEVFDPGAQAVMKAITHWLRGIGRGIYLPLDLMIILLERGHSELGFAIAGNNQVAPVIVEKFGWSEADATLYNTLISASAIFGLVFGALAGGRFIQ